MPPRNKLFTEELETRLVLEVQKRPILWDVQLDIYRRSDLKAPVWDEVAAKLGEKYSGSVAATRFKNIKDTFMQNVRKVRESHRCGAGTTDIYKPKWHLWMLCQFLLKTCDQAESCCNIPAPTAETENSIVQLEVSNCTVGGSTTMVYFDDNSKKFMCIPPELSPSSSECDVFSHGGGSGTSSPPVGLLTANIESGPASPDVFSVSLPRPASAPIPVTPSSSKASPYISSQTAMFDSKGSSKKRSHETMRETLDIVKQIAQQPLVPADFLHLPSENTASKDDDFDVFGKYVASRLRRMEKEKATLCENKLMEVLMTF